MRAARALASCALLGSLLLPSAGCRRDMQDQPKLEPLERSRFFDDARASRPTVPHSIARGQLLDDEHLYTGKLGGDFVESFPAPVTREMLERGRERYEIYCTPCHDRTGSGRGMIVQRGFPRAASFHDDRLRSAPAGYFFNAITNGFGVMPSYATQVPVTDRWAITAYIRVLQASQHAGIDDVEPSMQAPLQSQRESARE